MKQSKKPATQNPKSQPKTESVVKKEEKKGGRKKATTPEKKPTKAEKAPKPRTLSGKSNSLNSGRGFEGAQRQED